VEICGREARYAVEKRGDGLIACRFGGDFVSLRKVENRVDGRDDAV